MWGSPADLNQLEKEVREKFVDSLVIVPSCNSLLRSYDGIDKCAERLVKDIMYMLNSKFPDKESWPENISIIGYSAGGLVARNAVGKLYKEKFFDHVAPGKFITIATPHIGVRYSHRKLFGKMMNLAILPLFSNLFGGKSLVQMSLLDKTSSGLPLLVQMSVPESDYMKALSAFDVIFYANGRKDVIVSYSTATVSNRNPYRDYKYSGLAKHAIPDCKFVLAEEIQTPGKTVSSFGTEMLSVQNQISPYQKGLSLLIFTSISPVIVSLLIVQMVLLMIPLRAAALITQVKGSLVRRTYNHMDSCPPQPEVSYQTGNQAPSSSISALRGGEQEVEGHKHEQMQVSEIKMSPTKSNGNLLLLKKTSYPSFIRDNLLSSVKFKRVICWLPGNVNTHGKIIFRRGHKFYSDGLEIVNHIVKSLT